ncbi:MAG: hypothetical protein H7296_07960 [Bacteroidia bacterium]|nr:hypothetical protein [Bacteroidia bacterium]
MLKWLKILLITLVLIFTILGSCAIYIYYNLDQLKLLALKEVNKHLNAELNARDIAVTFWKTFPDVSLSFNQITIADPIRKNKKLLSARHLFMGFNFYDILNKKYQIHLLELDSAVLDLFVSGNNLANYNILKDTAVDKEKIKGPFSFKLNKLLMHNVLLIYHHTQQRLSFHTLIQTAELSGSLDEQKFALTTKFKADVGLVEMDGAQFLKEKHLELNTRIDINRKDRFYTIGKSICKIDALLLQLEGNIKQHKKNNEFDLRFAADALTIQELLSVLPLKLPVSVNNYKSSGKVFFNGFVKGIKSDKVMPEIGVKFGIEQGGLFDPETKLKLEHISMNGSYSNGRERSFRSSTLSLSKIEATMQQQKLYGNLLVQNFDEPILKMDLKGAADLAFLTRFLKITSIETAEGNFNFTLAVKGVRKKKIWDWSDAANEGFFAAHISKIKLKDFDKPILNVSIDAQLNKDHLNFKQLDFTLNKTTLVMKGEILKMMDFMIGNNHLLKGNFSIAAEKLYVEDLFIYNSVNDEKASVNKMDYDFLMNVTTKQLTYKNFVAEEFKIRTRIIPNEIRFTDAEMLTNEGKLKASGSFITNEKQYLLKMHTLANELNINQLLKEFDNFGQREITSKNLYGILTSETELMVVWDEKFNLIYDKLLMVSDLILKNGQLLNYEPMQALSRFVDVKELNNLKFSEMKNTLSIKNNVLNIPAMDIKNNALNLNLSGTHTLDNYLDYKIKLSLSELLNKKRKPQPDEFGEEDEKTNGMNLFITVKGPIDNLKFVYDKKAVKTKINQDIKKEKKNLKEIFKQEFKIQRDSTLKKTEKKNEKNDELEFEE